MHAVPVKSAMKITMKDQLPPSPLPLPLVLDRVENSCLVLFTIILTDQRLILKMKFTAVVSALFLASAAAFAPAAKTEVSSVSWDFWVLIIVNSNSTDGTCDYRFVSNFWFSNDSAPPVPSIWTDVRPWEP